MDQPVMAHYDCVTKLDFGGTSSEYAAVLNEEASFARTHLISGLDFMILPKTYPWIHFQTRYFRGRYRRPFDRRGTIDDVDRQDFM